MYVNNGECLDFGETAKTTTHRRFLGAISFLYHHDNVYTCADPGIFVGVGGGGVQARMTGKSPDVFFSFFISFVSPQFILQRESFSKKTIIQLHV